MVVGGGGDDTLSVTVPGRALAVGQGGSDTIVARSTDLGKDGVEVTTDCGLAYGCSVPAGRSNVVVSGGDVIVFGSNGTDVIDARGSLRTDITARGGDDLVVGAQGADEIHGGDGNDIVVSRGGADTVWGDGGNDLVDGGDGADRMYGGPGSDTVSYGSKVEGAIRRTSCRCATRST
jgi:Ca2+-binding RTX toxin-like protein